MASLEYIQDEVSSLHGSTVSLAPGSHRYPPIDERQLPQIRDQGDLENAAIASAVDTSRSDEKTRGLQALEQKPRTTTLRIVLTNSWLHEISSLVGSWACQIWLVIILLKMNNRPLDIWAQKISLNATVSALSTISKALLLEPVGASIGQLKWLHLRSPHRLYDFELFDQASRGPLGSVFLLARFRIDMVSLGCFVTILSAALGPFTQQVISYANRQLDVRNSSVTFGVAYNYSVAINQGSGDFSPKTFDSSIRANILGALYNSKIPPVFNCTSSCAWNDIYVTLGFGHECRDVTEAATSNRICTDLDSHEPVDPYDGKVSQECNMTTPGGVLLKTDHFPVFDGTWHTTRKYVSIASSSTYLSWYDRTPKHGKSYSSLVTLAQYERDPAFLHGGELKENVTECEVSAVAWRHSGIKVEGNQLAIADREKISLDDVGDSMSDVGEYIWHMSPIISFNETGLRPMEISVWDCRGLDSFLVNLLSDISNVERSQPFQEIDDKPPVFETSVSGGDIAIWVARMTEAMTSALQSGPNRQLMEGMSRDVVIFVQVDWLWYALPLVVEVGSSILLVFAIWQSRSKQNIPLWKTSALAQWAYRPEQEEGSVIGLTLEEALPDFNTVEKEAKRWKIRIH